MAPPGPDMIVRFERPTPPQETLPTAGMLIRMPRFEVILPVKMYCLGAALAPETNIRTARADSAEETRIDFMFPPRSNGGQPARWTGSPGWPFHTQNACRGGREPKYPLLLRVSDVRGSKHRAEWKRFSFLMKPVSFSLQVAEPTPGRRIARHVETPAYARLRSPGPRRFARPRLRPGRGAADRRYPHCSPGFRRRGRPARQGDPAQGQSARADRGAERPAAPLRSRRGSGAARSVRDRAARWR